MDLTKFKFPPSIGIFRQGGTIPELLQEAKDRGFYNGNTPYNDLFSKLFFQGGTLQFKPGVDEDFRREATTYMRGFMGSFAPKHEEKEAICAMILSEICEP